MSIAEKLFDDNLAKSEHDEADDISSRRGAEVMKKEKDFEIAYHLCKVDEASGKQTCTELKTLNYPDDIEIVFTKENIAAIMEKE